MTGATLRLPNEAIAVNSQGIHFNQFTMLDSAGNKAVLNGDILNK